MILALSLGVRHGFGLSLAPMSADFGWGRGASAFAIALQSLVWGLAQPFTGVLADRYGVAQTVLVGGLLYALGLVLIGFSQLTSGLLPSAGLLIGLGLSGTSLSVILGAVGRVVPAEQRNMTMGTSSAAGSLGQFAMLPGTLGLIGQLGQPSALFALGLLVALIVPLAGLMKDRPLLPQDHEQSLGEVLREARAYSGFWLLALGLLVCGFQVMFIGAYPPVYLANQHLPAQIGTTVLALVGLSNVSGIYITGWLGGRWSKPRLLTALYLMRGVVIVLLLWLSLSVYNAYASGVAMGLLWLSTVLLTNGIAATLSGVRNLSMLGGIASPLHQLGALLGGWLGGVVYDRTGSYDLVWQLSILLNLPAVLLNWPVRERPVARLQATGGAAWS